jgi:hypothetical protein
MKTIAERDEGQWFIYEGPDMTGPYPSAEKAREAMWPKLLCDDDYEDMTELRAECQDDCNLSLSHIGACAPFARAGRQTACDVCGREDRLTQLDEAV